MSNNFETTFSSPSFLEFFAKFNETTKLNKTTKFNSAKYLQNSFLDLQKVFVLKLGLKRCFIFSNKKQIF